MSLCAGFGLQVDGLHAHRPPVNVRELTNMVISKGPVVIEK